MTLSTELYEQVQSLWNRCVKCRTFNEVEGIFDKDKFICHLIQIWCLLRHEFSEGVDSPSFQLNEI